MSANTCDGWVRTIRGETVLFTGAVTVNGEHVVRKDCQDWVKNRHGTVIGDFSQKVTLLVYGSLDGVKVTDLRRHYSKKLWRAEASMSNGRHHIHVINDAGFESIINGKDAPCRRLRES